MTQDTRSVRRAVIANRVSAITEYGKQRFMHAAQIYLRLSVMTT